MQGEPPRHHQFDNNKIPSHIMYAYKKGAANTTHQPLTPTTNTNTNTDPNTNNNTSRCHHSPERRLLHVARRRNQTGRCTVCDSPCSYSHDGLSGWWFRTLCGARHRHGTSYERIVREVSCIFCGRKQTIERMQTVICNKTKQTTLSVAIFFTNMTYHR